MNTPTDMVCGSCRYYANEACHVDPPVAVTSANGYATWQRPRVELDDIACANFGIPYELEDRIRRHAERVQQNRQKQHPNPSVSERG